MINSIIESISVSLKAEFGDECKIYREAKRQDLEEPCFFIQCLNLAESLYLGKRYFRQNQFCIQYFPKDEYHMNQECCEVAERLFVCLEYLNVGDNLVRGTKMKYELVDGILQFFVNYDLFVYKTVESVPAMEEVLKETSVKG